MKNSLIGTVLLLIFTFPFAAMSQEDDAAQKEAMKKIQEAIEKYSQNGVQAEGQFKIPSFEPVNIDKVYHFTSSYTYLTKISENGRNNEMTYDLKLPTKSNPSYMAMETQTAHGGGLVIFDHELKSMIALSDENSGTIMSFESINKMSQAAEVDYSKGVTMTATGNDGKHMGFAYQEYQFDSPDGSGIMWVSKDEKVNLFKLFMDIGVNGGSKKSAMSLPQFENIDGLLIKSDMTSKTDGTKTSMELTKVNTIDETKNLSGYQIIDMSGMGGR